MSRQATVARLVELKEEYGVSSEEAFRTIRYDRIQERLAVEAARSADLSVIPTGDFVGKVCADIYEFVQFLLDGFDFRYKEMGWIARDFYLETVDHLSDERCSLSIDYASAVGAVCAQLVCPYEEQQRLQVRFAVLKTCIESPNLHYDGSDVRLCFREFFDWFYARPALFHLPEEDDYEAALREDIELGNALGIFSLSEEDSFDKLQSSYKETHRLLVIDWRQKISQKLKAAFPEVNPSLRDLYSGAALYERAVREMTLDNLWVQRRIALAVVTEITSYRSYKISSEIIGEILNALQSQIESAKNRRTRYGEQGNRSFVDIEDQRIERFSYKSQVVLENARWLVKTLSS